ncbi:MAG: hypothetical protein OXE94_06120 [Aestuariivita sp.]|nr:hypothetical protein [Aestuariivita sp.]MCY4201449.1 hypothetical protein [Aestuariivita sp.]
MLYHTIAVFAVILLAALPAQAEEVSNQDRALGNECRPFRLVVEDMTEDATKIGLTKDQVEITIRSRLRAAQIYEEDFPAPAFYVHINVIDRAFNINFQFIRFIEGYTRDYFPISFDDALLKSFFAITWDTGILGVHGGDADYILSALARATDLFVDDYLRVNAEACQ